MSNKLPQSSKRDAKSSPAKSGKPVRVASISIHQKHNKGVKQPYLATSPGMNVGC